jgi:hypothetical protein
VPEAVPPRTVLLDACTLLNLYATGALGEILAGLPYRFAVVETVLREEALYVLRPGRVPPEHEAVDLSREIGAGTLELTDVDGDAEAERFIALAMELDDGEARTLAVAWSRGWSVATDDRKAHRVAARVCPNVPLLRTLELVQEWAAAHANSHERLRELLILMRDRGNFFPGRHDPSVMWWRGIVDDG